MAKYLFVAVDKNGEEIEDENFITVECETLDEVQMWAKDLYRDAMLGDNDVAGMAWDICTREGCYFPEKEDDED